MTAHQGSFLVWIALMTVHVLAHLIRVYRATRGDLFGAGAPTPGRGLGASTLALSALAGVPLGLLSLSWLSHWLGATHRGS